MPESKRVVLSKRERPSERIFKPQCGHRGKVRFTSEKEALAYRGVYAQVGIRITAAYHCKHCHDWHLTSKEQGTDA